MARLRRIFLFFWRGANALSTMQWVWGLLPAGVVAAIVGWIAAIEHLPPVIIGLAVFAAFAVAYVIYVALKIERLEARRGGGFTVSATATVRDRPKPSNAVSESGEHFAELSETKHRVRGKDIVYEAALEFLQDAHNVAVVVETWVAEMSFGGYRWKRVRYFAQERTDRNRGDVEQIYLMELRVKQEGEEPPFRKGHIFGDDQARLKVRVTVTAAERPPFVEERLFLWKGNTVFPMPLIVPNEEGGDSIDFEEGQCVLWVTM